MHNFLIKIWLQQSSTHSNQSIFGVIHKECPHKFGNFWDPPPPVQACPHLVDHPRPSPCLCIHKVRIIWNIRTCEQFTLNGKKTDHFVLKNIWMKTIFEMMSLHCVPFILYWIQAEWKFYIQTYCQIIRVNFTNMVAIIFFPRGHPHLANHPLPWLHLSTFSWLSSHPNVWTSFIDDPLNNIWIMNSDSQYFLLVPYSCDYLVPWIPLWIPSFGNSL